ncbi:MAG: hypothetical protein AAF202_12425, partial [Pseudomonadota bacterium]
MRGASCEKPPLGINLPNHRSVSEQYGTKSITIYNIANSIGGSNKLGKQIYTRPVYRELFASVNTDIALDLMVDMHELLGHGSGKSHPEIQSILGKAFSPIEECRAEAAAVFFGSQPNLLVDTGILKGMDHNEAGKLSLYMIENFFRGQIHSYIKLGEETEVIKQAHQIGRQILLNRAIADGAIRINRSSKSGLPWVEVMSLEAVSESVGKVWHELQEIVSEGDLAKAEALMADHAYYNDTHKEWRAAVKAKKEGFVPEEIEDAFGEEKANMLLGVLEGSNTVVKEMEGLGSVEFEREFETDEVEVTLKDGS